MPRSRIERIRECIRLRHYDITAHALDEMAEDLLDLADVEEAILNGRIERADVDDPRGVRYVVQGLACDRRIQVGVVGRFVERSRWLIITVYEVA